jgi:hypothetical protein
MNEDLKQVLKLSSRIRERIINDCHITRATFSNWLNGKTPVPFWAKERIDVIVYEEIGKKIFETEDELSCKEEGGLS